MTDKTSSKESVVEGLKNEAVRQRWEMFHRAIAFAKASNNSQWEAEEAANDSTSERPRLSVIGHC
jgi:hypothetical protein